MTICGMGGLRITISKNKQNAALGCNRCRRFGKVTEMLSWLPGQRQASLVFYAATTGRIYECRWNSLRGGYAIQWRLTATSWIDHLARDVGSPIMLLTVRDVAKVLAVP